MPDADALCIGGMALTSSLIPEGLPQSAMPAALERKRAADRTARGLELPVASELQLGASQAEPIAHGRQSALGVGALKLLGFFAKRAETGPKRIKWVRPVLQSGRGPLEPR